MMAKYPKTTPSLRTPSNTHIPRPTLLMKWQVARILHVTARIA